MFDERGDGTDVRVSAAVTFALGLVTVAAVIWDAYVVGDDEGANIGFGLFVLLIATPAAVWAYVTTVVAAFRPRDVGVGRQVLGLVAVLLLTTPGPCPSDDP